MRRAASLLLPLLCALPLLAGCGPEKHDAYREADSEGQYIAAGGLKYQIQLSRELNPALSEDREYLTDLAPGTATPRAGREWFAIWMRVENDGKAVHRAASDFDISDTRGNVYTPIRVSSKNILSYQPALLQPKDIYPNAETAIAQSGPRRGAVILFQIATNAYQNRPLALHIHSPGGEESSVKLDL